MAGDPKVNYRATIELAHRFHAALGEPPPLLAVMLFAIGAAGEHTAPTIGEVAEIANIDLRTASRVLTAIRRRRWANVVVDPLDSRKHRVSLTPKGEALLKVMNGALTDIAFRVVENTSRESVSAD